MGHHEDALRYRGHVQFEPGDFPVAENERCFISPGLPLFHDTLVAGKHLGFFDTRIGFEPVPPDEARHLLAAVPRQRLVGVQAGPVEVEDHAPFHQLVEGVPEAALRRPDRLFGPLAFGHVVHRGHHAIGQGFARPEQRLGIDRNPSQGPVRFVDSHPDVVLRQSRPQRNRDRMHLARKRRAVLADGVPARVVRSLAADLVAGQAQDFFCGRVELDNGRVLVLQREALAHGRYQGAVQRLAVTQLLQQKLGLLPLPDRVLEQVEFGQLAPAQIDYCRFALGVLRVQRAGQPGRVGECADARQQIDVGDGACDEAVRACRKSFQLLRAVGKSPRGHDHHGRGEQRVGLDAPADFQSVHARHVPVQQRDIGPLGGKHAQGLFAVACRQDREAGLRQRQHGPSQHVRVIVDDQNRYILVVRAFRSVHVSPDRTRAWISASSGVVGIVLVAGGDMGIGVRPRPCRAFHTAAPHPTARTAHSLRT